jgi:hypothetical protein
MARELSSDDTINLLSMLSIGDSAHDFGDLKIPSDIGNVTFKSAIVNSNTGAGLKFTETYCDGLFNLGTLPSCFKKEQVGNLGKLAEDEIFKLILKEKNGSDITDRFSITPTITSDLLSTKGSPQYFTSIQERIDNDNEFSNYPINSNIDDDYVNLVFSSELWFYEELLAKLVTIPSMVFSYSASNVYIDKGFYNFFYKKKRVLYFSI